MADTFVEEQTDSFVFIQVNAQGPSRAGSVRSSVDDWSEISCPGSAKSTNSHTRKSSNEIFSVFSGTYLSNPTQQMLGAHSSSVTGTSDKGFYLVNAANTSQENGPVFSSNSTTFTNENVKERETRRQRNPLQLRAQTANTNAMNQLNTNNHSIGSVGSRVPFSWAEITKIQPRFHHESEDDAKSYKPKVFDAPTKIATRHSAVAASSRKSPSPSPAASLSASPNPKSSRERAAQREMASAAEEEIAMPSISETDPYATKGDLGRRMRRSGKRGSRLKYPNGKRGGRANKNVRRKKSQK